MNILVTGGAGFIGSNLCARLINEGHRVLAVDNLLTGKEENLQYLLENTNFRFKKCGVEEKAFLDVCKKSDKFDRVYHLACPTGVPNIELLGEEMLLACSQGTWNVLQVALDSAAKLLFTSSSEVYGEPLESPQGEGYTGNVETTGFRANYEEGKRFSETLIAHFVRRHGLDAKMVRLFNTYGPNMSMDDMRVIPRFISKAIKGEPLPVQGDGSQSRTLCFVSDILDGFEVVLTKGKVGEIYNLGGDQLITIKDFANLVIKMTKSSSSIQYVPRPKHDHSSRMPILDKARSLGWNNNVSLESGIKATTADFHARIQKASAKSMKKSLQPQFQNY